MDNPPIQADPPAGRAAGRLSLKAMVLSLLFIVLGVGGTAVYLFVAPVVAVERFLENLEAQGVWLERHYTDSDSIDGWIRAMLGYKPPIGIYRGPLLIDREVDFTATRAFRRLGRLEILPGKGDELGYSLGWLSEILTLDSLSIHPAIEDDALQGLHRLEYLRTVNLNAAKLNGDFLIYLPGNGIDTLVLTNATTDPTWGTRLRSYSALEYLSFDASNIDSDTLGMILGIKKLKTLHLDRSTVQWMTTAEVSTSGIIEVRLENMNITSQSMASISRLPRLWMITFVESTFEPQAMAELDNSSRVGAITIVESRITGETLRPLAGNMKIEYLILRKCDISNDGFRALIPIANLSGLRLNGSTIDGRSIKHILEMPSLKDLELIETAVNDEDFEALVKSDKLEHLDISASKVTGKGLEALLAKRSLKSLTLDAAILSPNLLAQIKKNNPQLELEINGTVDEEESDPTATPAPLP